MSRLIDQLHLLVLNVGLAGHITENNVFNHALHYNRCRHNSTHNIKLNDKNFIFPTLYLQEKNAIENICPKPLVILHLVQYPHAEFD